MEKDRFRQKEVCQAQTYLGGDDGQHYRVLIITKEEIQIRIVIFREKTFGIFTRIISSPPPGGHFLLRSESHISNKKLEIFLRERTLSVVRIRFTWKSHGSNSKWHENFWLIDLSLSLLIFIFEHTPSKDWDVASRFQFDVVIQRQQELCSPIKTNIPVSL